MAGDWLKIEVCTPDKPEVIGIADLLGIAPAHAFGALFLVWRWFDQHTTTGNASYVTKVTIDRLSGNAGFADAMARVGWLTINTDETVSLPHFDRHNGETAKQRGLTAKRVAKSKAKSNAIGNDKVTAGALPREEKRREEVKTSTSQSGTTGKFQMHIDWQPTEEFPTLAKMAMVEVKDGKLGEFIAYWLTQPHQRSQAEWDKALLQSCKHDKLHAESQPPSTGKPSTKRTGGRNHERAATIAGLIGESAASGQGKGDREPITIDA